MTIQVEVFSSPGCGKCGQAKKVLRQLTEEIGGNKIRWREVDILQELDYAVGLGVLTTPAIAVNGELVFSGLPSAQRLRKHLLQCLDSTDRELV